MESFLRNIWKAGLSCLLGAAAFFFWCNVYPAHLSYQEQFQLFLFDADYWQERVAVPGGVADYVAEYLTQFYYHVWAGACILSILFMGMQLLVWRLMKELGAVDVYYPLSFLPVIVLWRFMGDENAMLSFVIALLMVLVVACIYSGLKGNRIRLFYILIVLPLLYWVAGAVHFIFMTWVMVGEFTDSSKRKSILNGVGMVCCIGLLGVACPLLASVWVQFPIYRLMGGINYYRFPIVFLWLEIAISILLAALPFVVVALPVVKKKIFRNVALQVLMLSAGGYFFILAGCDMDKEEALDYDRLVRNKQWRKIIEKAEMKTPTSPFSVTCLNLALGKTGQLGDRMFEFYQNGTEGLLPGFQRDFTSPLPASEAFYHLGMINTAQRFTFEAMEAIPNFRKSVRCFKRLAETNLINGHYEVAAKYLRALRKTLFYKKWAEDTMTYLYNENKINTHKEWGWLRQVRYTEDFLFSDREVDIMLGLLYRHNHRNRMAFEYMLAYVMQQRDIDRFMKYYPLGKDAGYDRIPRSYQEALVYVWTQTHKNFHGMPWSISQQVMRDVTEFAQIYMSRQDAQKTLQLRFGGTYWYYLLFKK
ncbi:DUF6057 family protein [Bacteroides helcogenes]|uniref:Transmembrane protein n=1 Tax=Bacteroides helcogenes (strain ATCC 35417 / DSM 20613 / JCM 6297 / CCUG 15421 / P 36-108) TaxID=693979 RepID=E6STC9_BACT6|nr:DUF6057 family protein [Bacteroides helcogenes]ADV42260.1 putative transmembrane protein [Bacteroides helcogenes P 36-108]MDY5237286.1 DUF6057 family protein [Bacteroides helcogenes]